MNAKKIIRKRDTIKISAITAYVCLNSAHNTDQFNGSILAKQKLV